MNVIDVKNTSCIALILLALMACDQNQNETVANVALTTFDNKDGSDSKLSAAMQRHELNDSENELYARFSYQPLQGLGYEKGIHRRDPSSIIKVGDVYYVWYTRSQDPRLSWLNADIWYATSKDGITWQEQSAAVKRGVKGEYDDLSVFTTNILVADGKYYLTYQAEKKGGYEINVIAMAKADSPDGPWTKFLKPILTPTYDGQWKPHPKWENKLVTVKSGSWDSRMVHDPAVIPRFGKYWLYYKAHGLGDAMWADSKWGVAVSDHPEGPYIKSPMNPITNSGHEVWVWPWKKGIAAIVDWAGPEKSTVQYSNDGINFHVKSTLEDVPPAGGAYIADKFDDPENGQGFSWGLAHYGRSDWAFLVRFDTQLKQGMKKDFSWRQFPHYSTIRDVMVDPKRFSLPYSSLQK